MWGGIFVIERQTCYFEDAKLLSTDSFCQSWQPAILVGVRRHWYIARYKVSLSGGDFGEGFSCCNPRSTSINLWWSCDQPASLKHFFNTAGWICPYLSFWLVQPESHLLSLLSLLSISFFHWLYNTMYIYICICILNEYTYTSYILFKHILDLQNSLAFFLNPEVETNMPSTMASWKLEGQLPGNRFQCAEVVGWISFTLWRWAMDFIGLRCSKLWRNWVNSCFWFP